MVSRSEGFVLTWGKGEGYAAPTVRLGVVSISTFITTLITDCGVSSVGMSLCTAISNSSLGLFLMACLVCIL